MVDRKHELQETIRKAREELADIERREESEASRKLVGKFFRCRNCYSKGDYWWLYTAVTGLSPEGNPMGHQFEIDQYGKVRVESNQVLSTTAMQHEITRGDFAAAWAEVLQAMAPVAALAAPQK